MPSRHHEVNDWCGCIIADPWNGRIDQPGFGPYRIMIAISLAAPILGEIVETFHLVGIAAILAGIYLSGSRRRRSTRGI